MNKKINLYDTWLVNRTIAHRGLHDERLPENSLGAFRAAVEKATPSKPISSLPQTE